MAADLVHEKHASPIRPKSVKSPPSESIERISTVCQYCVVGCGYNVHLWEPGDGKDERPNAEQAHWVSPAMTESVAIDGTRRIAAVLPDPKCPLNKGNHSPRGGTMGRDLVAVDAQGRPADRAAVRERLTTPWIRTSQGWLELTNEDADELIAHLILAATDAYLEGDRFRFRKPERVGVKMFEYGSLENTYAATKLFYRLIGTPNVAFHDRPSVASNTSGCNDSGVNPHGYAYADIWDSDILFLVGSNPYECQSVLFMQQMTGKRLIVLDPRRTITADYAEKTGGLHLQPTTLGADVAVINALCRYIVEQREAAPDDWGQRRWEDVSPLVADSATLKKTRDAVRTEIANRAYPTYCGPDRARRARQLMGMDTITAAGTQAVLFEGFRDFLRYQPSINTAAHLSGIPAWKLHEAARLLSGPLPEVTEDDQLSLRYRLPDRRKVSIIFEKGIIWGYNYHGTAAVANLGLLLGSVLRPPREEPPDSGDPRDPLDKKRHDPAPLGVTGRAGGHQKGWAEALYEVQDTANDIPFTAGYPFYNATDGFDDDDGWKFPTHHYLDPHLVGTHRAPRRPWAYPTQAKPDINLLWVIGANPSGQMADAGVKWSKVKDRRGRALPDWDPISPTRIADALDMYRRRFDAGGLVVVQQDILANPTTNHADIVLPAKGWGEHEFTRYNGERRLRLYGRFQDSPTYRGASRCREDWRIFASIAKRLFRVSGCNTHGDGLPDGFRMTEPLRVKGFDWPDAESIFKELAAGAGPHQPGFGSNRNRADVLQPVGTLDRPYETLRNRQTLGVVFPVLSDLASTPWTEAPTRALPRASDPAYSVWPYAFVRCDWRELSRHFHANRARRVDGTKRREPFNPTTDQFYICNGRINELWNSLFTHIRNETVRSRYPEDMPGTILEIHPDDAAALTIDSGDVVRVTKGRRSFLAVALAQHHSTLLGATREVLPRGTVFVYFSYPVSATGEDTAGPGAGRTFRHDGYVNNLTSDYVDPLNPIAAVKFARGYIAAVNDHRGGKNNYFARHGDAVKGPSTVQRHVALLDIPALLCSGECPDENQRLVWKMRELIVKIGLPRAVVPGGKHDGLRFHDPDSLMYQVLRNRDIRQLFRTAIGRWDSHPNRMTWPQSGSQTMDQWLDAETDLARIVTNRTTT